MGRDPHLPFSYKINAHSFADPSLANTMCAFNSALKEASRYISVKDAELKKTLEAENTQTSSSNKGHSNGHVVEANLLQVKAEPESLNVCLLVGALSKTFRATIVAEIDDIGDLSPPAVDSIQDRRLIMPDGMVLDGLLLSLVELIEVNLGMGSNPLSVSKSEASPLPLWEFEEMDISIITGAGHFQSSYFATPSFRDASHYVHGPALNIELESTASSKILGERRERGIPLVITRVGIAALLASCKETVRLLSERLSSTGSNVTCPLLWRDNKVLRRNVCVALLNTGSPLL
jgi:hypothetical protein